MDIIKISAVGIITVFCVLAIKDNRPDFALAVSMIGGIIILLFTLNYFLQIFAFFESVIALIGLDGQVIKALIKMIGVGYLAEFCASIAEESGQKSLSDKIVLGGKVIILVLSFPIIETLIKIVTDMLV